MRQILLFFAAALLSACVPEERGPGEAPSVVPAGRIEEPAPAPPEGAVPAGPGGGLIATRLRCEYLEDPPAIDEAEPRLSWIVESDGRGQRQTAYRILVAGSPDLLGSDTGDLWDTGKVSSDRTCQIAYAGKALEAGMRCHWKVKVWDRDGSESRWSEPARWTMGILGTDGWEAGWIGLDREPGRPGEAAEDGLYLPPAVCLRKAFRIEKPVARATVRATALGLCELRLNGRRVGSDLFTPGWTDYARRVYYRTYDVTEELRAGENVLGAVLADGWYCGYAGPGPKRDRYGADPRLSVQLELDLGDGTRELVTTDETWKAAEGPIRQADLLMGETHDARLERPGWDGPGFDDSSWGPVVIGTAGEAAVEAHPGPPVRTFQEIAPVAVTEPRPGVHVFDMGQSLSGFARLRVSAPAGTRIALRFAERLDREGTIQASGPRRFGATDTYICRGVGEEIWQPRFTCHGFRYVELTGLPGKPTHDTVTGIEVGSDTPATGTFECSDEVANRLHRNILCAQRATFLEVPAGGPRRDERLGSTCEAQVFARAATYHADAASFLSKWLVDLRDARLPDGALPDAAPRLDGSGGGSAGWGDAGVIVPWVLWQAYGDTRILARSWDSIAGWIESRRAGTEGLLRPAEGIGDWMGGGPATRGPQTPKDLVATAYLAGSALLAAGVADALRKDEDAGQLRDLHDRIRDAFEEAWVRPDGTIRGDTQTAYVLALAFDLLTPELRQLAFSHLLADLERRAWRPSTGILGTRDLLSVLTEGGRVDAAYRVFEQTGLPSWRFWILRGATTLTDRWGELPNEGGSQDFADRSVASCSFGSVGEWMFRTIGGIDTDGPGFRRLRIRPRPGGSITWARCSYRAITGLVETGWRRDGGDLLLDVTVPANVTATVFVPTSDPDGVTERGIDLRRVEDVRVLRAEAGALVLEVPSGRYEFRSTM